ncbi:hypothetical protein [Streptomyces malaysiensis]|uniref:hypothetical protein n=1 Tax=Streptomyces malaysiensis TaxID=92644 RepID=UPI00367B414F
MTANIVILQLVILTVVLESDLGRRKIGWFRVARPVTAVAAIVPFFFTTVPTGGNDLILQGAGALTGALLGAFSVCPLLMSVGHDPAWRRRHFRTATTPAKPAVVSHAGAGYAAVWIAVTLARLGFAYGSEHIFPAALGRFLVDQQLSADALANAFILLAIAMDLARSLGLWARARTHLVQAGIAPAHA